MGCKRCGNCCMTAEIWLDPTMDDENASFAMKRLGAHLMWRDAQGHLKVLVGKCPHLSKDQTVCLIYDDRPDVCKNTPSGQGKDSVAGCRYYDDED